MEDKIVKLTNIFAVACICILHMGILKEEGLSEYIKFLPVSLPLLLCFIFIVKIGIFTRESFESMFSKYERPPIPYPMYLGFQFILFSIATMIVTLKLLGIAFVTK